MEHKSLLSQTDTMLRWFFENGVSTIDIHLRCPKVVNANYNSDDWFWLTQHNDLTMEKSLSLMKWCRFKNSKGSDIFIRPHRHDKQPIIFLDDLSLSKATMVSNKYRSIVIQTSPNNTQAWVVLSERLSENERKSIQQYISEKGFSDKGSISGEHLGRLCGFKSQKRKCWVKYVRSSQAIKYSPPKPEPSSLPRRGACANKNAGMKTMSEVEFSWVLSKARRGLSSNTLINILEKSAKARGKPSPEKYAERTVRRAIELLT